MRKLLFLFAFILVSCDMSEENVVEQEEQNLYTLIVHNTNATFQAYNRVELAGLTYVMESQNQSLIINGGKVGESVVYEAKSIIPQLKYTFIEQCGHFPWIEGEKQAETFYKLFDESMNF